jgi:hypothetical protein
MRLKGDLSTLKVLVVDGIIKRLKCKDGKWSSPREEEKMPKCAEFTLKWFGKKKEKLVIMKDNEEKFLQSALKTCAQMKINTKRQSTWSTPLSHNNKIRNKAIQISLVQLYRLCAKIVRIMNIRLRIN